MFWLLPTSQNSAVPSPRVTAAVTVRKEHPVPFEPQACAVTPGCGWVVTAEVSKAAGTEMELLSGQEKERADSGQWGWESNWTKCL